MLLDLCFRIPSEMKQIFDIAVISMFDDILTPHYMRMSSLSFLCALNIVKPNDFKALARVINDPMWWSY